MCLSPKHVQLSFKPKKSKWRHFFVYIIQNVSFLLIFEECFRKFFLKIVFFAKNAYYKNGANTNFVLFHTVKLVWKWRQIINSCLKYTQMRVKTLYLKWRHFLLDIMQNIYFSLIFRWFSSKNAKKLSFSAQTYNEKTAPLSHSPSLSPRKCQRMLLRHVSFPQACSIVI